MSHSEICPICHGRGKIKEDNDMRWSAEAQPTKVCHGCKGWGWVEVSDPYPLYSQRPIHG